MTDTSTSAAETGGEGAAAPARGFQSEALQRLLKAAEAREQQRPEPEAPPEPRRPAAQAWRPVLQPKRETPAPAQAEETLDFWGEQPAAVTAAPIGTKAAGARAFGPLPRPQLSETVPAPAQNNGMMIVVVVAALVAAVAIWLMVFSS